MRLVRLASQVVDPEREEAAADAPADPEAPAARDEWAAGGGEPGEGDPILGATLNALKQAAEGVEIERRVAETLQRSLLPHAARRAWPPTRGPLPARGC